MSSTTHFSLICDVTAQPLGGIAYDKIMSAAKWKIRCHLRDHSLTFKKHAHQGTRSLVLDVFCTDQRRLLARIAPEIRDHKDLFSTTTLAEKQRVLCERLPSKLVSRVQLGGSFEVEGQLFVFTLSSYIRGETASAYVKDRASAIYVARKLGQVLNSIHQVSFDGYGGSFCRESSCFSVSSWQDLIDNLYYKTGFNNFILRGDFSKEIRDAAHYRVVALRNRRVEQSRIAHMDCICNWGNILVGDDGEVYLIDWEYAMGGEPLVLELGSAAALFIKKSKYISWDEFISSFLIGYGMSICDYSKSYEYDIITLSLFYAFLNYSNVTLPIDERAHLGDWIINILTP